MFPFEIEYAYSDNGKEYKGEFKRMCLLGWQFTDNKHILKDPRWKRGVFFYPVLY